MSSKSNGKKNSTLFIVICLTVSFILLIIGGIFSAKSLLESYRKDKKTTNEIVNSIIDNYSDFESKIDDYNSNLTKIVTLINNSNYSDKLKANYSDINVLLDEVTKQIKDISSYEVLNKNCRKKIVSGKANRACSSYGQTYEKCINIYVDVVKYYNTTVKKIKDMSPNEFKDFKEYEGYVTDYVDYNSDGEFLGKNIASSKEDVSKNEE